MTPPARRYSLTVRAVDFLDQAGGMVAAGCCACCCCCLHWVGALIGAGLGFHQGFKRAERTNPVPRPLRRTVVSGIIVGLLAGTAFSASYIIVIALAPPVLLFASLATGPLLLAWKHAQLRRAYRAERARLHVPELRAGQGPFRTADPSAPRSGHAAALGGLETFCPSCWHSLGSGEVVEVCPGCNAPLDAPVIPAMRAARDLALAATGWALLWSTVATGAGYLLMLLAIALR